MSQPDFWRDPPRAQRIGQRREQLRSTIERWQGLERDLHDLQELARGTSVVSSTDLEREYQRLRDIFEKQQFLVLFSGPHDRSDAIVTIHAGSGGVEAQDWAGMLLRMYLRYCEKLECKTKIIDQSRGQEAGIKSVTFEVFGSFAYGYLKSEAGVHRLVRISPFDAEKMRHTSFALVEVIPQLEDEGAIAISDTDLRIETMRSGGHGGQSVNTTDSAVRITHVPTGIAVKCQSERSQLQNRQLAMRYLKARLATLQEEQHAQTIQEIRGEVLSAEWGNQIRSYVLQPYKMVKDHRTEFSSPDPDRVLDGNLDEFVEKYLQYINQTKK